jgi:hypothetical protein
MSGPSGLRLCPSRLSCPRGVGSTRDVRTACLHPPSGSDGMPGVLTMCPVDSAGCELISALARKPSLTQGSPERPRVDTETSARCCKELSTSCMVAVSRIPFSCRYTLSTPSVKGADGVSRSAAAAATFWLALKKVGRCPLMVDHHGPLRLKGELVLVQFNQLGLSYRSLASEFASSLCSPALDIGPENALLFLLIGP